MNNPFIVAEMSGNHQGDIEYALKTIEAAKECGADAIKIQTYTPDTITINSRHEEFLIKDKSSPWFGRNLYDLYKEAHTPWDWHPILFAHAEKVGITLFSSAFDPTSIDLLESLNNPIYKVASFEIVDLPLIKLIAETKKPMVLSTGIATYKEIESAISTAKKHGCSDLTVLHCISSYPAPIENTNLSTMCALQRQFDVKVGISDHSIGLAVSVAACALGASFVEKHFILDRDRGGVDSSFSMEPQEFSQLVIECKKSKLCIGAPFFRKSKEENKQQRQFARSLYVVKPVKKGDVFTEYNIRSIRPSNGLPPKYLNDILGRKSLVDLDVGTPLKWEMLNT